MNDVKAPRNAQSRSPRRARASSQRDSSDQLGELEFSDWYETPVFEPDEDELLEEAATSGHGPRRLMARMVLARDARKALRRPQWDEAPAPARPAAPPAPALRKEPAPAPARPAAPPAPAARKEPTPAPAPARPTAPPAPAARKEATPPPAPAKPAAATPSKPAPATPARPAAATPARPAAASPARSAAATPATPPATPSGEPAMPKDRWSDWATSGPSMDEKTMQQDLDRDSWRRRIDSFLDRWATAEVAVAARLDRSIEKVLNSSEVGSISSVLSARRHDSD